VKIVFEDGKTKRLPTVTEDSILGFFPPYRFLSNYHVVDVLMPDGLTYPSTENVYQAYKLLSVEERKPFTTCTPGEAKSMGQKVKLRGDWEHIKVSVMLSCLEVKFQNTELRKLLLETSPKYLEETNNWGDKFWGKVDGQGQNMLGQLLMQIRERLKNG